MPEAYVYLRCETGGELFEGKISWYGEPGINADLDRWNCTTLINLLQDHHLETNLYVQHNRYVIFDSKEQAEHPDTSSDSTQFDQLNAVYFRRYPSAVGHLTVTRQGNTAFHLQREPKQLLNPDAK
jgi:hypothetical protein